MSGLGKVSLELRAKYDTYTYFFRILMADGVWGRSWIVVKAGSFEEARAKLYKKYPGCEIKTEKHLLDMDELV